MAKKVIRSGQLFTRANPITTASMQDKSIFVLALVNKDGGSYADTCLQSRTSTMTNDGGP